METTNHVKGKEIFLFYFLISVFVFATSSNAQNISISENTTYQAEGSAMLDVMSTDKGVLVPRVTAAQRAAIAQPADGLLVYDTDAKAFCYYDGSAWQFVTTKAYVDSIKLEVKLEIFAELGVDDIEGKHYKTVKIGTQLWMEENLITTKFNDGTDIPLIADNTAWNAATSPAYCWYANDYTTYGVICGPLYNWYAVNNGNLCPEGWHVPDDAEWTQLTDYLGGTGVAGGKLKETSFVHWASPNTDATNISGFTALAGGFRYNNGGFADWTWDANFWSSTQYSSSDSWARKTFHYSGSVVRDSNSKKMGFSVRCLKNQE
jgi:uncharacterized protein (TIGR02145 family)